MAMVSDPDCIKAVNAIFEAMAYEQTVRAMVEPKQQELIDFFKFEISDEMCVRGIEKYVITKYDDLYMADEVDRELFYKEMHQEHLKLGFDVKLYYCPILIAESMIRDIKREVAGILEPYIGISYEQLSYNLKSYKQYYDLILTMFAGAVKEYQKTNAIKAV